MENLSFDLLGGFFNLRVGAIVLRENCLLVVKNSGEDFYYTVGGRVQLGESSCEAVLREAYEETGLPLKIDRLAFIHENFFFDAQRKKPFHEICFFYLMKPHKELDKLQATFQEEYGQVSFHWLPINELKNQIHYPKFLSSQLHNIPKTPTHIITQDPPQNIPN